MRAGLCMLKEEENKIIALKNAIQKGIYAGNLSELDPQAHLVWLQAKNTSEL